MKRIISLLYISALFLGIVSCDNEDKKDAVIGPQATTLNAVQGSMFVATLSGRVNGIENVALDYQYGIECSADETFSQDNTTRVKFASKYSEDQFNINFIVQPGRNYYYRVYYINQLMIYYGEIKTFSFNWDAPLVETLDVECNDEYLVTFTGYIQDLSKIEEGFNNSAMAPKFEMNFGYYGIEYSTSERFEKEDTHSAHWTHTSNDTIIGELDAFAMAIVRLEYGTTYYYRAFFNLGGIIKYGATKSFVYTQHLSPASYICDITIAPFNQITTPGRFVSVRKHNSQLFIIDSDGNQYTQDLTSVQQEGFKFGLAGFIIGTPTFNNDDMSVLAYDLACPECTQISRLSFDNNGIATCSECENTWDLNNSGIGTSLNTKKSLTRYRALFDNGIINVCN